MPLVPILDLTDDVEPYFGISCCDNSKASRLLQMVARWTESQARKWVGHGISQNTYENEFHRRSDLGSGGDCSSYELLNGRVLRTESDTVAYGNVLKLDNAFARSVTEVRVDESGGFGGLSGTFGVNTIVDPANYYLEFDATGLSKSGCLIRNYRSWPSMPGTIRVTYIAGFTSQELNTDYSFVKQSLLEEMRGKFNCAWSQQGASSSSGVKKKEVFHGDYTVEYAVGESGKMGELSTATKAALYSIVSVSLS